jgi:AcrR family transcriptional regulator
MNNVQEESSRNRKKDLRRVLMLDSARDIISRKGLISLKVRDVADAASCSIGSVYNEFGDFDGLILTINRETVTRLTEQLRSVGSDDPRADLIGLAVGYLGFAVGNTNLLRALFEHRMEGERPFPEDILDMVMEAFALMYSPLSRLLPDRAPEEVALIARTMFSAAHGIISLGLEDRMVAVPQNQLKQQLTQFVEAQLVGLGAPAVK